jgi:hypothetical protein
MNELKKNKLKNFSAMLLLVMDFNNTKTLYSLPLIKKIYEYIIILDITLDVDKLTDWLNTLDSPFLVSMIKLHINDLSTELKPLLDLHDRQQFKIVIRALRKYHNPIPLLLFLTDKRLIIPKLYLVIKGLRQLHGVYLQNAVPQDSPAFLKVNSNLGLSKLKHFLDTDIEFSHHTESMIGHDCAKLISDMRMNVQIVNSVLSRSLCSSCSDFFEHREIECIEYWLEELGLILYDFAMKAREIGRNDKDSIPILRDELRAIELLFCPIINNTVMSIHNL